MQAAELPVLDILPDLRKVLSKERTVILQAPPGAGKSTVLPLELIHEPWLLGKKILMLEPRRLAAKSVATRMASQLEEAAGQSIGYRVRFETKVSSKTRIEVLTEGILTRILQNNNSLDDVGLLIFDEFHERSLQSDLAFALSREVQAVLRDDLRILIMSATLDGEYLSQMLDGAPIITSTGRQFPVDITYQAPEANEALSLTTVRAIRRVINKDEGDILVFLPGAGDIHKVQSLLQDQEQISIHPLYGNLSLAQQQAAILPDPYGKRKVVLATSIAETSLTIEGVKVVIDSGFTRISRFEPRSGLTRLVTTPVTQDAADQRAGRAGRLGPGRCVRLWAERQVLVPQRKAEILEADLAPLLLELSRWGLQDICGLCWITPPPAGALAQARELLIWLGALNDDGIISKKGAAMLDLPTHPRFSHMLLEGKEAGLAALACDAAAVLEERDPMAGNGGADLGLRIETLRKWRCRERVTADNSILDRIEKLSVQWRAQLQVECSNEIFSHMDLGMLIAAAYPERVAKRKEGTKSKYRLANGRSAKLQEHDELQLEEYLAIADMDAGTEEGKIFLASAFDPNDLQERITEKDSIYWDQREGKLIARRERKIGEIILSHSALKDFPAEQKSSILCDVIRLYGNELLTWSEETKQWQARVLSLRKWRPAEDWPDVSKEYLVENAEDWLLPFVNEVKNKDDLQKLDMKGILLSLLPWNLINKLDEYAPAKIEVPSGSMISIQYQEDGSQPVLAVRLQEVFGWLETPRINEGRTPLMLHLLSPAYRPAQVTQDLHSFWEKTYAEVRKDLRGRYPKHSWPEDPLKAEAVKGVRKKN